MNTKAQDTVHAKYYKQQIRQSILYNKARQESQALYEAGMRGEIMRSGYTLPQQEAIGHRREILEYCTRVQSAETIQELREVII